MKRISLSLVFCASLFIIGCKNDKKENDTENATDTEMNSEIEAQDQEEEVKEITVPLEPKSGSELGGEVKFTQENGEVTMEATITGLAEGQHAIHIHQKADCSA